MNLRVGKYLFPLILLYAYSCAQQRGLSGGEKDTAPPQVVSTSPDMLSTHFTGKSFEIQFNEYVGLNNIAQELIVSPPLLQNPKVKVRQKKIIVEWEEELLQNTTYTFNFGDGVADVNENNVAQNLTFVFSTGSAIDSLSIHGNVHHAAEDIPAKACKVMAFSDDSTLFSKKPRPVYFTKTKEDGNFKLENMRAGEYFLYALDDVNGNYRYDEGENIAFLSRPVNLSADASEQVTLNLSLPLPTKLSVSDYIIDSTGHFRFAFDAARYSGYRISSLKGLDIKTRESEHKDTIYAAFTSAPTNTLEDVVVSWGENVMRQLADTISIPFYREALAKPFKLQHNISKKMKTDSEFLFYANCHHTLADASRVVLLEDSAAVSASILPHGSVFRLNANLKPGKNYELVILPGALLNTAAVANDTLRVSFTTYKPNELGNVVFNFSLPDETKQYILLLKDKNGTLLHKKPDMKNGEWIWKEVPPGEYTASVFRDENNNLLCDPGEVFTKSQPELMQCYQGAIMVRANWDVKINWEIKP